MTPLKRQHIPRRAQGIPASIQSFYYWMLIKQARPIVVSTRANKSWLLVWFPRGFAQGRKDDGEGVISPFNRRRPRRSSGKVTLFIRFHLYLQSWCKGRGEKVNTALFFFPKANSSILLFFFAASTFLEASSSSLSERTNSFLACSHGNLWTEHGLSLINLSSSVEGEDEKLKFLLRAYARHQIYFWCLIWQAWRKIEFRFVICEFGGGGELKNFVLLVACFKSIQLFSRFSSLVCFLIWFTSSKFWSQKRDESWGQEWKSSRRRLRWISSNLEKSLQFKM